MSNGSAISIKHISLGGLALVASSLGGVFLFGEKTGEWVDGRAGAVCEEQVSELTESVGNLRGQVGELWMGLCEARRRSGERVYWWRGSCEEDRR